MFIMATNSTVIDSISGLEAPEAITQLEEELEKNPNFIKDYIQGLIPEIINFAVDVLISVIIFFIGKKIINMILKFIKRAFERANVDIGVINFVNTAVKILLYIILFLMIGSRFGIQATSVVALLGSAGIAIGLALQDSLSNVAGGILLLVLKPFKIGDYIIEQNSGYEGTVTEIAIYYTKLNTADNKTICLPNGSLVNSSITNATEQGTRRLEILVGISYDSDIKKAKETLNNIIVNDESRIEEENHDVFVSELGENSVILGIRMWVKSSDFMSAKWRITEEIKYKFDENNIKIPYNQLDINIKNS